MAERGDAAAGLFQRGRLRPMSRRFVVALIVAVVSALTGGAVAAAAWVAARLGIVIPTHVWIWIGIGLDALFIYAVFERRAPVFGRIVSRGRPRAPAIAITFDDGPTEPYTSQILDVLRQFRARATFFVLGARAERAPEVENMRRIRLGWAVVE